MRLGRWTHLLASTAAIGLVGAGMHFVHELSGCNPIVGFLGAVNESAWEHLKLMLWPMLFWWVVLAQPSVIPAVAATYPAAALLLLVYAIAHEGYRWGGDLAFHITLFVVSVAFGQFCGILAHNRREPSPSWAHDLSILLLFVEIACLSSFTLLYTPRAVPFLFQDPSTGRYGPRSCASS
jgi:hypothetical protein